MDSKPTPGANTKQTWRDSDLWRRLCVMTEERDACRLLLQLHLPTVELVLNQGASPTKDFTLHDAEHGLRVAQLMSEVVPEEVLGQLAAEELDHDLAPGQEQGREGYKRLTATYFSAFSEFRVRNEDVIVEGDKAALRWTARGRHTRC